MFGFYSNELVGFQLKFIMNCERNGLLTRPQFWIYVCPMHTVMSWQIVQLNSSLSIHVLKVHCQIPMLRVVWTMPMMAMLHLSVMMMINCPLFEIYHTVNCPSTSWAVALHSSNSSSNYLLMNVLVVAHHQIHSDNSFQFLFSPDFRGLFDKILSAF